MSSESEGDNGRIRPPPGPCPDDVNGPCQNGPNPTSAENIGNPLTVKVDGDGVPVEVSKLTNNQKPNEASKEAEANGGTPPALPSNRDKGDAAKGKGQKGIRAFFDGVKADLMNKDLLPLKILFFFKYASKFINIYSSTKM